MTTEEWRPVVGWEGLYEVSNLGNARSLDRKCGHSLMFRRGGPISTAPTGVGRYPRVSLWRDGVMSTRRVHVLVAEAFIGPRPSGLQIRHLDGNTLNCAPSNLSYGTAAENMADQVVHGTVARGERNGSAKLTNADVAAIKARLFAGRSGRDLAVEFGVSTSTISLIRRGRNWGHV